MLAEAEAVIDAAVADLIGKKWETDFYNLAKETYLACGNDLVRAREALVLKVADHPAMLEEIVLFACNDKLRIIANSVRQAIWTEQVGTLVGQPLVNGAKRQNMVPSERSRVEILAASNLMMFELPSKDGKRVMLGGATKDQVEEGARFYLVRAAGAAAKHRWLKLISERLGDGEKVRDVLDKNDLKILKDKAGDHE